jgi:ribonuclease P protein component
MLPKKYRLSKKEEFEGIFNKGKRQNSQFFVLFYAKNNLDLARFAFLVTKKAVKNSTARNRIKRMEREAVRRNLDSIRTGYDYIFLAKKEALKVRKTAEISDEIKKTILKIK